MEGRQAEGGRERENLLEAFPVLGRGVCPPLKKYGFSSSLHCLNQKKKKNKLTTRVQEADKIGQIDNPYKIRYALF